MKILFVTLYPLEVNTSVTQSNYGLIEGIIKLGHDLTVLMPENNTGSLSLHESVLDGKIKICRIRNDNIGASIALTAKKAKGLKARAISLARDLYKRATLFDRSKILLKQIPHLKCIEKHYDIVISTSDPVTSHLFVEKLIKDGVVSCEKWIQHWGDPLASDVSANKIFPNFVIRKVELSVISKCDKVVYVSPFTCEDQRRKYSKLASKMFFAPLPCVTHASQVVESTKDVNDKKTKICYLGAYYKIYRNIMPLYNACVELDKVTLIIAGNTDVALMETGNVSIKPRISQDEASIIEMSSDIIVSICNMHGTQIPGKIHYVSDLDKPILIILDGENAEAMREYFESYDRFYICDNNVSSIKEAIQQILNSPIEHYQTPDSLLPEVVVDKILK